jgi:hypothetical protein
MVRYSPYLVVCGMHPVTANGSRNRIARAVVSMTFEYFLGAAPATDRGRAAGATRVAPLDIALIEGYGIKHGTCRNGYRRSIKYLAQYICSQEGRIERSNAVHRRWFGVEY